MTRSGTLLISVVCGFALIATAQTAPQSGAIPLSTKSARVHRLLDLAWKLDSDQVEQDKAIEVMRKVVSLITTSPLDMRSSLKSAVIQPSR